MSTSSTIVSLREEIQSNSDTERLLENSLIHESILDLQNTEVMSIEHRHTMSIAKGVFLLFIGIIAISLAVILAVYCKKIFLHDNTILAKVTILGMLSMLALLGTSLLILGSYKLGLIVHKKYVYLVPDTSAEYEEDVGYKFYQSLLSKLHTASHSDKALKYYLSGFIGVMSYAEQNPELESSSVKTKAECLDKLSYELEKTIYECNSLIQEYINISSSLTLAKDKNELMSRNRNIELVSIIDLSANVNMMFEYLNRLVKLDPNILKSSKGRIIQEAHGGICQIGCLINGMLLVKISDQLSRSHLSNGDLYKLLTNRFLAFSNMFNESEISEHVIYSNLIECIKTTKQESKKLILKNIDMLYDAIDFRAALVMQIAENSDFKNGFGYQNTSGNFPGMANFIKIGISSTAEGKSDLLDLEKLLVSSTSLLLPVLKSLKICLKKENNPSKR